MINCKIHYCYKKYVTMLSLQLKKKVTQLSINYQKSNYNFVTSNELLSFPSNYTGNQL